MNTARPLDALATAVVALMCLSWGFNQVATKLAIPEVPPLIQAAIRSCGALPVILVWARWRGISMTVRDGTLLAGIAAGLLFALEFMLIYRGLVWTTASRAILFLYTAPFFVALGARPALGERLSPMQWAGLALSFAGVGLAMGVPAGGTGSMLIGDLMLMGGGGAWAATTLLIKKSTLAHTAPEKTLAYQLVISGPALALAAWLGGERVAHWPGPVALGSLAYQTIWVVAVTYALWFAYVQRYSASRLSSYTFLTPLFGVAAGHLVLGEPITPAFAAAVAPVVLGLALVNRPQ